MRKVFLLITIASLLASGLAQSPYVYSHGAIIRGNPSQKCLALVFTGGDYNDGGWHIRRVLKQTQTPATFFFTGDFYRQKSNRKLIRTLLRDGHYLGAHSDKHLLYCAWEQRDSLLVTKTEFIQDLQANYQIMAQFGIKKPQAAYFMPPYEWYNDTIAAWTKELGLQLVNFTPGTLANADYTIPSAQNYRSTEQIYQSIINYEQHQPNGLNGFILLLHIGTHPERTDKFYWRLAELLTYLKSKGYTFVRIDHLLQENN
jgi:peptidoglycan/xylan/chitin deacetylase (PgdA/CDA1 family)